MSFFWCSQRGSGVECKSGRTECFHVSLVTLRVIRFIYSNWEEELSLSSFATRDTKSNVLSSGDPP